MSTLVDFVNFGHSTLKHAPVEGGRVHVGERVTLDIDDLDAFRFIQMHVAILKPVPTSGEPSGSDSIGAYRFTYDFGVQGGAQGHFPLTKHDSVPAGTVWLPFSVISGVTPLASAGAAAVTLYYGAFDDGNLLYGDGGSGGIAFDSGDIFPASDPLYAAKGLERNTGTVTVDGSFDCTMEIFGADLTAGKFDVVLFGRAL